MDTTLMQLLILDIVWLVCAVSSAKEEAAWSWPFRNISIDTFDTGTRLSLLKTAHRNGAISVGVLAAGFAVFFTAWEWQDNLLLNAVCFVNIFLLCLFEYWLLFDISYSKSINKPWHFIGTTATLDRWLWNLGKNAGKTKAYICVAIIIALHALFILL